jgi:hypothetical protein
MGEPKWTPGPWRAYEASERCPLPAGVAVEVGTAASAGARSATICEMIGQGSDGRYSSETTNANADLIASAPDLYAALEATIEHLEEMRKDKHWHPIGDCPVLNEALRALAKARGETP